MADSAPSIQMDFGIARLQATGGEDDSLEEVREVFNEQRQFLLENVEDLKRLDFELVDEYREESEKETARSRGPSRTFG